MIPAASAVTFYSFLTDLRQNASKRIDVRIDASAESLRIPKLATEEEATRMRENVAAELRATLDNVILRENTLITAQYTALCEELNITPIEGAKYNAGLINQVITFAAGILEQLDLTQGDGRPIDVLRINIDQQTQDMYNFRAELTAAALRFADEYAAIMTSK